MWIISPLLLAANLVGLFFITKRALKLDWPFVPLATSALTMIALYLASLVGLLSEMALLLTIAGCLIFVLFSARAPGLLLEPMKSPYVCVWLVLVVMAAFYVLPMQFSTGDPYKYWGAISKYLYIHHHLPALNSGIFAKHLNYTPGSALWQYYIVHFYPGLSQPLLFWAQDLLVISGILAVSGIGARRHVVMQSALVLGLLVLFHGSVFAKLQVEAVMTVMSLPLLVAFLHGEDEQQMAKLLPVIVPVLYLVKKAGILLGLLLLVLYGVKYLSDKASGQSKRLERNGIVLAGIGLIIAVGSWELHNYLLNIPSFIGYGRQGHPLKEAVSINPWPMVGNFVYHVFLGSADRLKLPYFVHYLLMAGVLIHLWRRSNKPCSRMAIWTVTSVTMLVMYLAGLCVFEIIAFPGYSGVVGATRYFNILFAPIMMTVLLTWSEVKFANTFDRPLLSSLVIVTAVLLILAVDFQTRRHEGLQADHSQQIQRIKDNIKGQEHVVCVYEDKPSRFKSTLNFYLMPNKVSYQTIQARNKADFMESLSHCDYLYVHDINDSIRRLLPNADRAKGLYAIERTPHFKLKPVSD